MKMVKAQLEVLHIPIAVCLPFQSFNFIVDALCVIDENAVFENWMTG